MGHGVFAFNHKTPIHGSLASYPWYIFLQCDYAEHNRNFCLGSMGMTMRTIKTVLVLTIALWFTAPAVAQTRTAPETMTSSVPINAYMVGAGVLALATASGLINMYNAGFMLFEGAPLTEAFVHTSFCKLIAC